MMGLGEPEAKKARLFIWKFFTRLEYDERALCSLCKKDFKIGVNEKNLQNHLQTYHNINEWNYTRLGNNAYPMSCDELTSRLIANGEMRFTQLTSSKLLQDVFKLAGKELPNQRSGLLNSFLREYSNVHNRIAQRTKSAKRMKELYTLDIREASFNENRKFYSINLHSNRSNHLLGMIRVSDDSNDAIMVELINKKLGEFGLNLKEDILAVVTSGSPSMEKLVSTIDVVALKPTSGSHIVSIVHMCVSDMLNFKLGTSSAENKSQEGGNSSGSESCHKPKTTNPNIKDQTLIINKCQSLVTEMQEAVQNYLSLPVDETDSHTRTSLFACQKEALAITGSTARLTNLLQMVNLFTFSNYDRIQSSITMSGKKLTFTKDEMRHLTEVLKPLEGLTVSLETNNTDMVGADDLFCFTLKELNQRENPFALLFHKELKKRYLQKRDVGLIHLMNFLKTPRFLQMEEDYFGEPISWKALIKSAAKWLQEVYSIDDILKKSRLEENDQYTKGEPGETSTTMSDFEKRFKSWQRFKTVTTASSYKGFDFSVILRVQQMFQLHVERSSHYPPTLLETLGTVLFSIKSVSVDDFSSLKTFIAQEPAFLQDHLLNALVVLHKYYADNPRK